MRLQMYFTKKLKLFSILIPVSMPGQFVDLQYSSIKPNEVNIKKSISISVNKTASPTFYKFDKVKKHSQISVSGSVQIKKALETEELDSYFQLGVIYEGDYRPGFITKKFLPEWILKIVSLNKEFGLGEIDFFHVTGINTKMSKTDNIGDVKLNFKTIANIGIDNTFKFRINLKDKKVLGLWLRADGDDHDGVFTTKINHLDIE